MNVLDLARNITHRMDNDTLKKTYLVGFISSDMLAALSSCQEWWRARVETISKSEFPFSNIDWKQTYQLVAAKLGLNPEPPYLWNEMDNPYASSILYFMGKKPCNNDMNYSAWSGSHNILAFLLAEGSIDPNTMNLFTYTCIEAAAREGHFEATKLLLADNRVILRRCEYGVSEVLMKACEGISKIEERVKILQLLLADPRILVDHTVLYFCSSGILARELVADKRIDPTADDSRALEQAIRRRAIEVVRVLLEQSSVAANINERIREVASIYGGDQILTLVLAYEQDNRQPI